MDLTAAINCIRVMKEYGTYRDHRVGVLRTPVSGDASGYDKGRVVIYRQELSPSDSEMRMGEYMDRKQKPTGLVTIEIPMTPEEIDKKRAEGFRFTTWGTMICVPEEMVEEIIF
jgi:hypothetical protein